jgi:hypothetical protein
MTDTRHNNALIMLSVVMINIAFFIVMLSINILSVIMLSVVMPSVVMLSVIILSVVLLYADRRNTVKVHTDIIGRKYRLLMKIKSVKQINKWS